MYRVVKTFRDAETRTLYRAGDIYHGTDEKRLKALSTANNRRGVPLIERVVEGGAEEEKPRRGRRKTDIEE